jgi:DMSO/TMAO reductase YedYZ molybdopterin-dependent catalytic subunit
MPLSRRHFIKQAGSLWLAAVLPFENGERPLIRYPQKRALLRLTSRPPQLETPFSVFNEGPITPNDAFFVRYHLSQIPLSIDPGTYRLSVGGKVKKSRQLSLQDLKKLEPVEIVAVNQCSGNSRGFVSPRVAGGQLGNGAMGNARWKGARLRDVLALAGVEAGAKQVSFNGLDTPAMTTTPDFVKTLAIDHALEDDVILAYSMNGADLPLLNGYPLRLVVPGYFGTYWVKHLSEITVLETEFPGYWMGTAYRIPDNDCACVEPGTKPAKTAPIQRLAIRSFLTSHAPGAKVARNRPVRLQGIAFDGGSGIREVSISLDGGKSWKPTVLGQDLGKYSFRQWHASVSFSAAGESEVRVRATSQAGATQPTEARWNPPGYLRNVVESVRLRVGG